HIRNESSVHKAFPGSHIGNISNPQLIWPVRGKVAIDQVRRIIWPSGLTGCYRGFAFGLTGYDSQSHQTCGLFTTDINPLATKSVPHLSHSINTVIFSVDFADVFCQSDRRADGAS